MTTYPPQSPFSTGLAGKCPRCGQGHVFRAFLAVKPKCESCDLDFAFADSADGPAVFLMFLVGFIVVGGALYLEFTREPPLWVHAAIWPALAVVLTLGLLRPLKGLSIALQFANKAEQGRLEDVPRDGTRNDDPPHGGKKS
ncbi:MAG: DUF983 domain-containing protein [Beijerinckiaceae bacterium]